LYRARKSCQVSHSSKICRGQFRYFACIDPCQATTAACQKKIPKVVFGGSHDESVTKFELEVVECCPTPHCQQKDCANTNKLDEILLVMILPSSKPVPVVNYWFVQSRC
jgi:hypothetical protein